MIGRSDITHAVPVSGENPINICDVDNIITSATAIAHIRGRQPFKEIVALVSAS